MIRVGDHAAKLAAADAILALYRGFAGLSVEQRKSRYEMLLRRLAAEAQLPMPRIRWRATKASFFSIEWAIELPLEAVMDDTADLPLRKWLFWGTAGYHELRHCEQWFLMIQAMLAGALPIPSRTNARDVIVLPPGTPRVNHVALTFSYPMRIVQEAERVKASFTPDLIPLVRGWRDALLGGQGRSRVQTLNHVGRGPSHYGEYVNLPEEVDAWAHQRTLNRMIRERVGREGEDEALEAMQSLFG